MNGQIQRAPNARAFENQNQCSPPVPLARLFARLLACLLARGLPTPLVRFAVPARTLSECSAVCRFPLSISLAFPVSLARVAAQAHIEMHIYAHTNLSFPLFPSLPSYISNPAFPFSLLISEHSFFFFVPLVNSVAFCLRISISSPSLTSLDQVSRTKSRRERERERGKQKAGVKLPPSEKRPTASPPLSTPLPSQSVFTPIPRQHHQ